MKNILFINGSPRKKGNTSFFLNKLSDLLQEEFVRKEIFLYDLSIKPCNDCRACKGNSFICTVKDDMQSIYNEIDDADILILGTPIYWFGPTAIMKNILDRFRPYYVNKKLHGKKAVLVLPAGTGAPDCDLTIEMFNRSFKALGVELLGSITSESYDEGDAQNDKNAISQLNEIAKQIKTLV